MGYLLLLNPSSGSGDGEALLAEARGHLDDVEPLALEPGTDLGQAITRAVRDERVVVAAGGDGTVNSAAQHMVGRGVLGVVPGGTLNHFARDLGVRDLDAAFEALRAGATRTVDVGRAGDRVFVNTLTLGLYPEVVQERERTEERIGKWLAAAGAAASAMRNARPLSGRITADGDARLLFAWMLFVGNNRFSTTPGSVGTRTQLDEGILDVRLLTVSHRRAHRSRLALRVLRSGQWSPRRLVRAEARRLEVALEGEARVPAWDGETGAAIDRLEVEIVPQALRVIAPEGEPTG